MNKWLACLLLSGIVLPLIIFTGNLGIEAEGSETHEELSTIYLGYELAEANLGNGEGFSPGRVAFYEPPGNYSQLKPNIAYLGGYWLSNPDSLELASNEGRIVFRYGAKKLDVTAGSDKPSLLQVILNGEFLEGNISGNDVAGSFANIGEKRSYSLISESNNSVRTVEVNVRGPGLKVYDFKLGK